MKIGEITAHSGWSLPLSEFALTDISFARALVESDLLSKESKKQSYHDFEGSDRLSGTGVRVQKCPEPENPVAE